MRILAIFAFSFAAGVFGANYLIPEEILIFAGLLSGGGGAALWFWSRLGRRRRLFWTLAGAGLAAGLLWTTLYGAVVFQPARDLDDRTVIMEATVSEWPQQTDYGYSVLVRAETGSFVRLSALLYTDDQGAQLRPGDRISTVAHYTLGDRTFAGEEITCYTAKGIFLRAEAYGRLDVERPEHIWPHHWPAWCARALKGGIDAAFPTDAAPLVRALVTGNRDHLTDSFTTSLQRTGLSHTVAVSGMHLAFLASVLSLLMGRGKRSTALAVVACVVVFCGVAGNTPSVTRAAVMILMLQIAPLLNRERDSMTSLAFALMLLLLWNPYSAAHVGLQLSFAAVAGILLVSEGIQDWMLHKLRMDCRSKNPVIRAALMVPRFLISTLAATLGASVLTVPLVAVHFRSFSLISPLSNLLTLWAVAILFLAGMVCGTLAIFWPAGGAMLALPFVWLARYLDWVVPALAKLPFASIPLDSFYYRAWMVYFCLLIGLTLGMKGRKRLLVPLCAAAASLAACVWFNATTFQSGELTAAVLDVGQGQSVLLRAGNYLTLVDCGGDRYENAGDIAADYIQSLGRGSLDLLVVSHYHTDHANGIPELLERIRVDAIALPDVEPESELRAKILARAEEQQIEVWFIREDTEILLGEEQKFTLYAPLGSGTDTNELGLTVLASAGDFDVLLTGDMGGEGERLLLDHALLPNIELMVVGHHGSRYSTTDDLLLTTLPDVAAISVGADNRYGHPAEETMERLDRMGAEIYRTDLQGTIVIRSGEKTAAEAPAAS